MVPLSITDRKRFTPESYEGREGAPVYITGPLGFREKGRFNGAMAEAGVRYPSDKEIADTATRLVNDLSPENRDELLAAIAAYRDILDQPRLMALAEDAGDDGKAARQAEINRRVSIAEPYDQVLDALRSSPRMASLLRLRTLYNSMIQPLAAAHGLRGWENVTVDGVPLPFKRVDGVVPDDLLNQLDPADLVAIGNEVLIAMTVTPAQRGN